MPTTSRERWTFTDSTAAPVTVTTWIAASAEQRGLALEPATARWTLNQAVALSRRDEHRQQLIEICLALDQCTFDAGRVPTEQVLPRVLEAVDQGLLLVVGDELLISYGGGGGAAEPEPEPPEPARPPPPRPPPTTDPLTWIEIQVVDEAGVPHTGRVRIDLPNGSSIDGSLDSNGILRLDQILPGACKITLVDVSDSLRV